jgi:hypothetical protein
MSGGLVKASAQTAAASSAAKETGRANDVLNGDGSLANIEADLLGTYTIIRPSTRLGRHSRLRHGVETSLRARDTSLGARANSVIQSIDRVCQFSRPHATPVVPTKGDAAVKKTRMLRKQESPGLLSNSLFDAFGK